MLDPHFLQYDLAEQKATEDMKQAIADHDTQREHLVQMAIADIRQKRNALDIAQRPQASRLLHQEQQKFIETMRNAPPLSNVDPAAYAHSQAPTAAGDGDEYQRRMQESAQQQQDFDDMVRRENGQ